MTHRSVAASLDWTRSGTAVVLGAVAGLADGELDRPSALPGWTRRHVIAHLARNAEAVLRLLSWAQTEIETPMYADPEQRAAEIETTSRQQVGALRTDLAATAVALDDRLRSVRDDTWSARIRTATGREVAASEVPWLRAREVWIHAVDLQAAITFADCPAGFVDAMIDDVLAFFAARPLPVPIRLVASDRRETWELGAATDTDRAEISGTAAGLLAWLIGRGAAGDVRVAGPPPVLPSWL